MALLWYAPPATTLNRVEGGANFTVRLPEVNLEIEGEESEVGLRDTKSANSHGGGELQ